MEAKKYRKKPVVIEAAQWFKNGDHPEDNSKWIYPDEVNTEPKPDKPFLSEGKVVRYFRDPEVKGTDNCRYCNGVFHDHGWIDTMEGGHVVCPGDFIITGIKGEHYPCKPDIFEQTYEEVI